MSGFPMEGGESPRSIRPADFGKYANGEIQDLQGLVSTLCRTRLHYGVCRS